MKGKKGQGFRKKVIRSFAMIFFYSIGILFFILWFITQIIMFLIYGPEVVIAFIVALFRDRWQMWLYPRLEDIAQEIWFIIIQWGDCAKKYAP